MFPPKNRSRRRGLTLMELLWAISVTATVAALMAVLASAVSTSGTYVREAQTAAQQALAAMEHIKRLVGSAYATAQEPGVTVIRSWEGMWQFPDTLVIWLPQGEPANPQGPPLVEELVLICPDPLQPEHLIQVRAVGDQRTVSLWDLNTSFWQAELERIKKDPNSQRLLLCQGLRTANVNDVMEDSPTGFPSNPDDPVLFQWGPSHPRLPILPSGFDPSGPGGASTLSNDPIADPNQDPSPGSSPRIRAGVFFGLRYAPREEELDQIRQGTLAWEQAAWPQGLFNAAFGIRQVWVAMELQMSVSTGVGQGKVVLPLFGSATLYYQVPRDAL